VGFRKANPKIVTVDELYDYALSYFGTPYQWGTFDCSKFVELILAKSGVVLPRLSSEALYQLFATTGVPACQRGALAFFGSPHVVHVGWMIDDRCMISAAGGGPQVTSIEIAKSLNANVKIQPLSWYKEPALVATIMPPYPFLKK
jgi:cell wall-associated NlpC family hydrolase